jgi:hypothetical protein
MFCCDGQWTLLLFKEGGKKNRLPASESVDAKAHGWDGQQSTQRNDPEKGGLLALAVVEVGWPVNHFDPTLHPAIPTNVVQLDMLECLNILYL